MKPMKGSFTPPPRSSLFFDIETEGREDALDGVDESEFAAPANWKDPDKIAAKVSENKQAALRNAALSAMTGRILVIATALNDSPVEVHEGEERVVIERFMRIAQDCIHNGNRAFGFNILGFDLPFIAQRATVHGIQIPVGLYSMWRGRFNWHENFVDVQLAFLFGQREVKGYSLKKISALLNLPVQKTVDGSAFSGLYREDRDKALEYVRRDVDCTRALAKRLFLV